MTVSRKIKLKELPVNVSDIISCYDDYVLGILIAGMIRIIHGHSKKIYTAGWNYRLIPNLAC